MNKKNNFLIFGILLVLTIGNILALGVTPGKKTLNYPGDLNGTFSFKVLNSENKDFDVFLSVSGELADYITLKDNYYHFSSKQDFKEFVYSLNIPEDLSYGEHSGQIIISEANIEGKTFGGNLGVVMGVYVFVPYPSRYIESDLTVYNVPNKTVFLIPVVNKGEDKLNTVSAVIDIYSLGEKIETLNSDSIELDSMERGDIVIENNENLFGNFQAHVILNYDGEIAEFDDEFKIGELSLDIYDLFIEDFELGSIVEMEVLIQNKWTEPLNGVYATLILKNESGDVVNINSVPENIDAFSKKRVPLYWDTSNIARGNYYGELIVKYKDFSNSKKIDIEISDYGIGIQLESGEFILQQKADLSEIIIISLVLFGLILFFVYKFFIRRK